MANLACQQIISRRNIFVAFRFFLDYGGDRFSADGKEGKMGKKCKGRMINVDISLSRKVGNLSPHALSLFCMLIPHFNAHGKMLANPYLVKGLVCPLIDWMTPELIQASLIEISDKTNVKFWQDDDGLYYLHSLNWTDHQELKSDRLGPDYLPSYDQSRINPGLGTEKSSQEKLRLREVEGKEEGKDKGEEKNKTSPSDLFELWNEVVKTPCALKLSSSRKIKSVARLKERSLEEWRQIFERIAGTPFLRGKNDRDWFADFDWIIANDSNAVKVLEGKYDKCGGKRTPQNDLFSGGI